MLFILFGRNNNYLKSVYAVWDQNPAKCIAATDQKIISGIQKCNNILHKLKKKECKITRKAKNVVTDQNIRSVNQKITSMNKNFKHIKIFCTNLNLCSCYSLFQMSQFEFHVN